MLVYILQVFLPARSSNFLLPDPFGLHWKDPGVAFNTILLSSVSLHPVNLGSFEGRLERPKSHKSMKTKRRPWSFQLTCPTCKKLPKKLRIEGSTVDEEIHLGTEENPRPTYISALLSEEKREMVLLLEFIDVFAWTYKEMQGLDPEVAVHYLGIDPLLSNLLYGRGLSFGVDRG